MDEDYYELCEHRDALQIYHVEIRINGELVKGAKISRTHAITEQDMISMMAHVRLEVKKNDILTIQFIPETPPSDFRPHTIHDNGTRLTVARVRHFV